MEVLQEEIEATKSNQIIVISSVLFFVAVTGIAVWYLMADGDSTQHKSSKSKKIQIGSRGEMVKVLQRKANSLGADIEVDGIYGDKTFQASKKYLNQTAFKFSEIAQFEKQLA